jgi:predicted component of type VI protein secretion system
MSEDKLKKFIQSERDDFDSEGPSEGVWDKIHAELHEGAGQEEKPRRLWAIAASIAAIVSIGALFYTLNPQGGEEDYQERMTAGIDISVFGEELAEVDRYYTIQVDQRMEELSAFDVDDDLMEEMNYLNEEFESLKSEMGDGIDDSKVVEALIENYRLRLTLLEDLLKAVQTKNNEEDDEETHI